MGDDGLDVTGLSSSLCEVLGLIGKGKSQTEEDQEEEVSKRPQLLLPLRKRHVVQEVTENNETPPKKVYIIFVINLCIKM